MTDIEFLPVAQSYLKVGLCILPASAEKKHPTLKEWKEFQIRLPTEVEVCTWFKAASGLAVVTGTVSGAGNGGLFLMDFDEKAQAFMAWRKSIPDDLFNRLVIEKTQHDGRHVYWRSVAANTRSEKFARNAEGKTLIESRCEGGLVIAAPTPGYKLLQGRLTEIPVLTADEHGRLISAARALDKCGKAVPMERNVSSSVQKLPREGLRPGDDYNERGQDAFRNLLQCHGWRFLGKSGENENWQRPGKEGDGNSATFNGKTFYVFSTNAAPFEEGKGYSPFHVYTLLEHSGDFSAAARTLVAQGYGQSPVPSTDTVVAVEQPEEGEKPSERILDPGELPESLCEVQGPLAQIMDHTLKTAPHPNVRLAFAGALAVWAHICGLGRIADVYDTRPNLYLLALGESGTGKNAPRKVNKELMTALGVGASLVDSFASGAGLEDCFIDQHAILSQFDEFHKLFAALKDNESVLAQGISQALLQIYSESDQIHVFRRLATTRPSERNRRPSTVSEPHLTLFATGIPALTFAKLSIEAMTDGLAARCLLIEAGERGAAHMPCREELPPTLLSMASRLVSRGEAVSVRPGVKAVPACIVDETSEATALRHELQGEADRLYTAVPDGEKGVADRALYARLCEKAAKLALVLAVNDNPDAPRIEVGHLQRGWAISIHSTERIRWLANRYLFENEYDALAKRALRFFGSKSVSIPRSSLLRSLHVDKMTFDRLIETLVDSRQIISVPGSRAGAVKYKLA